MHERKIERKKEEAILVPRSISICHLFYYFSINHLFMFDGFDMIDDSFRDIAAKVIVLWVAFSLFHIFLLNGIYSRTYSTVQKVQPLSRE